MPSGTAKVTSNSAMLLVAEMMRKIFRMVLVIVAARLLGVVAYGQFSFALAFTTVFLIVTDFGIHQLLIREVARKPEAVKRYLQNALIVKVFLSALTFALIAMIIHLTDKPVHVIHTVYIMAAAIILMSFVELFKSVFQAFQQMKFDAVSTLIQSISVASLGIGALLFGGSIRTLASMYLASYFIVLVYCAWVTLTQFTRISLRTEWPLIKFMFREGAPIGINYFFSTVYSYADTLMLSLMINDEVVGWYNVAYRLIFSLQFISMGITKAIYPALSSFYKESMERFRVLYLKAFKVMLLAGVSLATVLSILSERVIVLLYGEEYINAATALRILSWAMALVFVILVLTSVARSSDRQRFTAKVVGLGAFFNVTLNWIIIPKYSYVGAAWTTLATQALVFLIHLVYLSKAIGKLPLFSLSLKVIVINGVLGLTIYLCSGLSLALLVVIGLIVFAGMVLLTRYFSRDEFDFVEHILNRFRS